MRSPVTKRGVFRPVVAVEQHSQLSDDARILRLLARGSVCLRDLILRFAGKAGDVDLRDLRCARLH